LPFGILSGLEGCGIAPNCFSRNRLPCLTPRTYCGDCLPGFKSHTDVVNEPCTLNETISTQHRNFEVHIIDLEHGDSSQILAQIKSGLVQTGFLVLTNHGISSDLIDSVLDFAQEFFAKPLSDKNGLLWSDPGDNIGYVQLGQEGLSEDGIGDQKEALDVDPRYIERHFRESPLATYWSQISALNLRLLRLIAMSLDLSENSLTDIHQEDWNTLRILHYPPNKESEERLRAGAHSDYGSLTFLLQDAVGGLELLDRISQRWVPMTPIKGSIVVNCGDLLMMLTDNLFPSTMHRVVAAPTRRYSSAFFTNPDPDVVVHCKNFFPNVPCVYKPILSRQYLHDRLSATYEEADISDVKTEL